MNAEQFQENIFHLAKFSPFPAFSYSILNLFHFMLYD